MTESSCQDKRRYQSGHLGKNTNHRHSWLLILFNKAILSLHCNSNNPASLLGITFNQIVVSGKSWVLLLVDGLKYFKYLSMIPCSQLSLTRAEGPGHSLVWAGVTSWYLTTRAGWCFLTLRNLFVSPTIHPSIPNYQHNNILMLTTLILFFIAYKIFCDFYPLLFSGIVIFRISEEFKRTMNVTRGLRAGAKICSCWWSPSVMTMVGYDCGVT